MAFDTDSTTNPSVSSGGSTLGVAGAATGAIAAGLGASAVMTAGATLIPILLGMGISIWSNNKAANKIEERARAMIDRGLLKESEYTGRLDAMLAERSDMWRYLMENIFTGGGVPKNATYESVFGERKNYGFTPSETPKEDKVTESHLGTITEFGNPQPGGPVGIIDRDKNYNDYGF